METELKVHSFYCTKS